MGWKRSASCVFVAVVALLAAACTPPTTPAGNAPPVAVITAFPTTGVAPLTVNFDSNASSDSDGTIVLRTWDFGDATPPSNVSNPTHTYTGAGTYFARLS